MNGGTIMKKFTKALLVVVCCLMVFASGLLNVNQVYSISTEGYALISESTTVVTPNNPFPEFTILNDDPAPIKC